MISRFWGDFLRLRSQLFLSANVQTHDLQSLNLCSSSHMRSMLGHAWTSDTALQGLGSSAKCSYGNAPLQTVLPYKLHKGAACPRCAYITLLSYPLPSCKPPQRSPSKPTMRIGYAIPLIFGAALTVAQALDVRDDGASVGASVVLPNGPPPPATSSATMASVVLSPSNS